MPATTADSIPSIPFASFISDLRELAGMTLAEIGAEVDLSPSAVSDIEQGRTEEPKGTSAVRLYELHKSKSSAFTKRRRA